MAEKIKVVTTKKACELLNCSHPTFYQKYKQRVKQYPSIGKSSLFSYDDVMIIVEENKNPITDNYIIVE